MTNNLICLSNITKNKNAPQLRSVFVLPTFYKILHPIYAFKYVNNFSTLAFASPYSISEFGL